MKSLWVEAQLCIGCYQCVLACSFEKELYFSPDDAWLVLFRWEERGFTQPVVCTQCEDAPCVRACSVGAISRDPETEVVIIEQNLCASCGLCVEACPVGVISLHRDTGQAIKCDLCGGHPVCVTVCPWEALTLQDRPWSEFKQLRDHLERVRDAILHGSKSLVVLES